MPGQMLFKLIYANVQRIMNNIETTTSYPVYYCIVKLCSNNDLRIECICSVYLDNNQLFQIFLNFPLNRMFQHINNDTKRWSKFTNFKPNTRYNSIVDLSCYKQITQIEQVKLPNNFYQSFKTVSFNILTHMPVTLGLFVCAYVQHKREICCKRTIIKEC